MMITDYDKCFNYDDFKGQLHYLLHMFIWWLFVYVNI